jgi:hypothetical protein
MVKDDCPPKSVLQSQQEPNVEDQPNPIVVNQYIQSPEEAVDPVVTVRQEQAPLQNVKRWDRIHELVVLALLGWIVGSSWSHTLTTMFDQVKSPKWRLTGLFIWCIVVTLAFVSVVWMTTESD